MTDTYPSVKNCTRVYDWSSLDGCLLSWEVLLNSVQRRQVENYLDLVACHNLKSGLTADIAPQTLLLRHAADALACVPVLKKWLSGNFRRPLSIADLGSGGGFIGVTLKIALPEIELTLIEPLKRRFDFLNLTLIALGLKGLHLTRKAANQSLATDLFDIVVERALAPFPKAATLAATLLKPHGIFIAYQSEIQENPGFQEVTTFRNPSPLAIKDRISYQLPHENRTRYLIISEKEV
jgi:16S rRNA (guanine527-N7)-methyltransferase